jgi:hypothetical protein
MEKFWKIKNVTNVPVKITVRVNSNMSPGIILQPNQFCLGYQQMTAPLDKQSRTKMVAIEDFDNSEYNLELAKAYNESVLDKAKTQTSAYTK